MKLEKKKEMASRVLGVGKGRIVFNQERLSEIKEAITKQDIKDLLKDKAIHVREFSGRRRIVKRSTRRRDGSIRKKSNLKKKEYMLMTRKLRTYLLNLKKRSKISSEDFLELRKQIRARNFRSLSQMKEAMSKNE